MIGLDTNVLVRYVVQDDPGQAERATQLLESLDESNPGFVSQIVLVELTWVLKRAYQTPREDILLVLQRLLRTRSLMVEHATLATQALHLYANGTADFSDCLIQHSAMHAGCQHTYTFDKLAARDAGMSLL